MTEKDKTKIAGVERAEHEESTELDESLFDLEDSLARGDSSLVIDDITEQLDSADDEAINISLDEPEAEIDLFDDDATEVSVYASNLGNTNLGPQTTLPSSLLLAAMTQRLFITQRILNLLLVQDDRGLALKSVIF